MRSPLRSHLPLAQRILFELHATDLAADTFPSISLSWLMRGDGGGGGAAADSRSTSITVGELRRRLITAAAVQREDTDATSALG